VKKKTGSPRKRSTVSELEARVRRLERLLEEPGGEDADPSDGGHTAGETLSALLLQGLRRRHAAEIQRVLSTPEFDYYLFETYYRGASESIRERQEIYLSLFHGHENVLDIGCGRGEFLQLLAENFIPAYGIDLDRDNVLACEEKNLTALQGDALAHLESLPESSLGGVYMGQVVEHMDNPRLLCLCERCYRALAPGGVLVADTLNPHCLSAHQWFWLDPTHVRLIPPELLRFNLEQAGFGDCRVQYLSPVPEEESLSGFAPRPDSPAEIAEMKRTLQANFAKLNQLLYSHMEYAVMAYVPQDKAEL